MSHSKSQSVSILVIAFVALGSLLVQDAFWVTRTRSAGGTSTDLHDHGIRVRCTWPDYEGQWASNPEGDIWVSHSVGVDEDGTEAGERVHQLERGDDHEADAQPIVMRRRVRAFSGGGHRPQALCLPSVIIGGKRRWRPIQRRPGRSGRIARPARPNTSARSMGSRPVVLHRAGLSDWVPKIRHF